MKLRWVLGGKCQIFSFPPGQYHACTSAVLFYRVSGNPYANMSNFPHLTIRMLWTTNVLTCLHNGSVWSNTDSTICLCSIPFPTFVFPADLTASFLCFLIQIKQAVPEMYLLAKSKSFGLQKYKIHPKLVMVKKPFPFFCLFCFVLKY